jgi:hypothetical protein
MLHEMGGRNGSYAMGKKQKPVSKSGQEEWRSIKGEASNIKIKS